ncbi:MAG: FixH family protein [Rhodobacteraceae bacterium]|nr:FixH family protein [Paracoccaceae bacterium]
MTGEITGRKVFVFTAAAFAVIIGVNVVLAVQAVRTFPGLEVANSYVASQTFDADRRAQEALGWHLATHYDGAVLRLDLTGPDGRPVDVAKLEAVAGRPTEASDDVALAFHREQGAYVAPVVLGPGRWVLFVRAEAQDGTAYRKRLDLHAGG